MIRWGAWLCGALESGLGLIGVFGSARRGACDGGENSSRGRRVDLAIVGLFCFFLESKASLHDLALNLCFSFLEHAKVELSDPSLSIVFGQDEQILVEHLAYFSSHELHGAM